MAEAEKTKKIVKKAESVKAPVKKVQPSTKPANKATPGAKPASKPVVKKEVVKAAVEKKPVVKEAVKQEMPNALQKDEKKYATISIDVYGLDGKVSGKVSLPGEMFGEEVNKTILAQAVRVYLANQRQGNANTKTRGEVVGSTAKIYRQKGTGRARHGSKRAPIFVKGGVAQGPRLHDFSLSIPQKMKRKALFVALSAKVKDKEVTVVDGLLRIKPKTKEFVAMLTSLNMTGKKQKLLVVTAGTEVAAVVRAGRNIQGIHFISSRQLNTYEVLGATRLVMMKESIDEMKEHFLKK